MAPAQCLIMHVKWDVIYVFIMYALEQVLYVDFLKSTFSEYQTLFDLYLFLVSKCSVVTFEKPSNIVLSQVSNIPLDALSIVPTAIRNVVVMCQTCGTFIDARKH